MIGFLIINYNDAKTTIHLLENIKNYRCLDKIVVVDNGSTDHSMEVLKNYESEHVIILRRDDGRQFGGGINFGLRYLESLGITHTFISNSDVEIEREEELKKILKHQDEGSILAPVIKEHQGLNRGWKVPTNWQLVLSAIPFFYRFFKNSNLYEESYYEHNFLPVEVVSFCFFFVNISDIKKVGYLDEKLFLYFEENTMSCKLGKKGIYLCLDSSVFHNHSVTINKNLNRRKKYQTLSTSRRYFAKYYNEAGRITLFLLWIIEKATLLGLRIVEVWRK
jgi:GT2 family glycosyltransferase